MIHQKFHTTCLEFQGDCDWERIEVRDYRPGLPGDWIVCKHHPEGGGWHWDFRADGWDLPIEEFKKKWGVINLEVLGRSHCKAGYTDRLHPEKSWTGHNPATLEKLKKYMEQLEKEQEHGSEPSKD